MKELEGILGSNFFQFAMYPVIIWFIKSIHDDVKKLTEVSIRLVTLIEQHAKTLAEHSERIRSVEKSKQGVTHGRNNWSGEY